MTIVIIPKIRDVADNDAVAEALFDALHEAQGNWRRSSPQSVAANLTGLLVELIFNWPEADWQALMKGASVPCGKPDCHCHETNTMTLQGLDRVRRLVQARYAKGKP